MKRLYPVFSTVLLTLMMACEVCYTQALAQQYPYTQRNPYAPPSQNTQGQYPQQYYPPQQPQQPGPSTQQNLSQQSQNLQSYADYAIQANAAIEKGDLTTAIQLYEKAWPLATDQTQSVVLNNLAAIYMRRGNFFHEKMHQDAQSLSDYRKAYYYLDLAWPEGLEKKPLHANNLKIAKDNLKAGYANNGIDVNDAAVHMKLGKELRLQGKFQEALVEYARAAELDTKSTDALKAMGDLSNVLNMPDKSKKYYAKLVATQGNNVKDETLVNLASAQNKSGQLNDAIQSLNKALEVNPNNTSALAQLETIWRTEIKYTPSSVLGHANLAGVLQKMKRYDEALQQYRAAETFADQDAKVPFETKKLIRLNLGTLFQEMKKYDMAENAYKTILAADKSNQQATYYMARLFKEVGKTEEAIKWYHNLLALDANNADAHVDLLQLILGQSDPQKASLALKTYGDRFPENAMVQYKVGEELHKLKDFDLALQYYQKAVQLKPDLAAAFANMGAIYQAKGQDEASIQAFKKALALDPNNETVKNLAKDTEQATGAKAFQKGVELQQSGQHQASISEFQKALQTMPNDPNLIAALGIAYQNTGKVNEAIAQYIKAQELDPKNGHFSYYLGTAYHQQNQLEKAKAAYQKAVSLDNTLAEAQQALDTLVQQGATQKLNLAIEAYGKKQYPQALALVNEAIRTNPTEPTAYYYKGLIQQEQKQPELAIQSYREAIDKKADFSDAYYALGVLLDTKKDVTGAKSAFQKYLELSTGSEDDFVKYARARVEAL
jgi:tetratricopeptide (TPR) repeat protein